MRGRHPQVTTELVDRVYQVGNQSRSVVEDVLDAYFKSQPWQRCCDVELPQDGSVIYGREQHSLRFKLYHPDSMQYKRGQLGRWQIQDHYLGWENYPDIDQVTEWRKP